jgi:hypothetical protein
MELYKELINAGVNDFSVSLDACCSAYGDKMAGGIDGIWDKVVSNIKELSKLTYVSVGVVLTEETLCDVEEIVDFADGLGVADIRIIPSAQFDGFMNIARYIRKDILDRHPILKYRVNNVLNGVHVRGLHETDNHRCPLILDDMAIAGNFHFPCVIYMREQGNPIGKVGPYMRQEREKWMKNHDTHCDTICKKNCLDVCIDYNNKWLDTHLNSVVIPEISRGWFDIIRWGVGSVSLMGIDTRYNSLTSPYGKAMLRNCAIGWTRSLKVAYRPKDAHVVVMYRFRKKLFWTHMRNNEFLEVFSK